MTALRRRDLVGVLSWVVGATTLLALVGMVVPGLGDGPDEQAVVTTSVSILVTTLLLLGRDHPPRWLGPVGVLWVEIAILGAIATEADAGTAGFLHLLLVWTGLLTFPFLGRRAAWTHGLLVTGVAAASWHHGGAEPAEVVVAAVLLLGTIAGVGAVVAMPLERAAALARTDDLTSVANRRGVMELLETLAARPDRAVAGLVLIDLDGFKQVNDTQGHAAGDRLLQDLAARWSANVPDGATLGRLGGDEFLVVLPTLEDAGIAGVVERLRAVTPDGVGVSIGTTVLSPPETVDAALRRADDALYVAKRRLTRRASDEEATGVEPRSGPGDEPRPRSGPGDGPRSPSTSRDDAPTGRA